MQIQITNLDLNLIEADVQRLFVPYGELNDLQIVRDQRNNRSKGMAFLEMPVEKEARQAIVSLNGVLLGRKNIVVTGVPYSEEHLNRYFNS